MWFSGYGAAGLVHTNFPANALVRVTLKVNGERTVEFAEPEGWKGAKKSMSGRMIGKGSFNLQAHDPGSAVFYKEIRRAHGYENKGR